MGIGEATTFPAGGRVVREWIPAISLNFSLVNDLLRNPEDSGKAMSILIVGGNSFGVAAPIVTGYVIQATGSYNWAFGITGLLLVAGATILLTMTCAPIEIATFGSQ